VKQNLECEQEELHPSEEDGSLPRLAVVQIIDLHLAVPIVGSKVAKRSSSRTKEENDHDDLKCNGNLVINIGFSPFNYRLNHDRKPENYVCSSQKFHV